MPRIALEEFLQGWNIDNYVVTENGVRIGSRTWLAEECNCGFERCDGWALTPVRPHDPSSGAARPGLGDLLIRGASGRI
jgi:hypothetical protein